MKEYKYKLNLFEQEDKRLLQNLVERLWYLELGIVTATIKGDKRIEKVLAGEIAST